MCATSVNPKKQNPRQATKPIRAYRSNPGARRRCRSCSCASAAAPPTSPPLPQRVSSPLLASAMPSLLEPLPPTPHLVSHASPHAPHLACPISCASPLPHLRLCGCAAGSGKLRQTYYRTHPDNSSPMGPALCALPLPRLGLYCCATEGGGDGCAA